MTVRRTTEPARRPHGSNKADATDRIVDVDEVARLTAKALHDVVCIVNLTEPFDGPPSESSVLMAYDYARDAHRTLYKMRVMVALMSIDSGHRSTDEAEPVESVTSAKAGQPT